MRTILWIGAAIAHFCVSADLRAQVVVGDPTVELERIEGKTVPIVFTLTRDAADNPPRGAAVWVFAKFQSPAGDWRDVRWAEAGHVATPREGSAALNVIPATGGFFIPGVFVEAAESGAFVGSWMVELIWDFSTSEIEVPEGGLPLMLLGLDMVRIPEGPFLVGDGRASQETSTFFGMDGGSFAVESEREISLGTEGELSYAASDFGGDQAGPLPESFPKGYRAFYVMRQELTDGQYASFLQTISGRARAARDVTLHPDYASSGGSITVGATISAGDSDRPASFITWADGIAWAAWAGLRPMTELEFEKIARGPNQYGVVDMLGSRWERVVTIGTPEGRAFKGSHGLGFVDDLGQPYTFANADWPGPMALGSGFRGGFTDVEAFATPGNRVYAAYDATYGGEQEGFRAVRTAPISRSTEGRVQ